MRFSIFLVCFLFSIALSAQRSISQVLKKLNKETVPYITIKELQYKVGVVLLDARETKEFQTSHIKNAINVGFEKFDSIGITKKVKDKNAIVVVYCSIGVRSEQIGEKLLKLGYKNVYNLYGGIFEYKNSGGKVVNNQNKVTDSIHTFNKTWSAYLTKGIKVYEN